MIKNILKTGALLAIFLVVPFMAEAQDQDELKNSTPEERAKFQTEWMKKELSLDSAVVPTVYKVNLKYARKNQSLMNSGGSRIQKYREFKTASEDKDRELKKILTTDQYKIYEKKKEEMKQKMKERFQERRQ